MTYGEERVLCACVSLMIFFLAAGIFAGLRIPRTMFERKEPVKDEQWFIEAAAEIYTLAMEWYGPDGISHREISRSLKKMTGVYNHEARKIKKWTYRCPPCFTLEYLGIETEEDKNEKRN